MQDATNIAEYAIVSHNRDMDATFVFSGMRLFSRKSFI